MVTPTASIAVKLHSDGRNATSPYLCYVGDNLPYSCYVDIEFRCVPEPSPRGEGVADRRRMRCARAEGAGECAKATCADITPSAPFHHAAQIFTSPKVVTTARPLRGRTSSTAGAVPLPHLTEGHSESRGRLQVSLFCKYGHLCCPRRFGKNLTYPCCVDVRSRSAPKAKAWVKPSRRLADSKGRAFGRAPQSAKIPFASAERRSG